jgi:Tfp pilus assembly protein PilW
MGCKSTSIERRAQAAFTLVEFLLAAGLASIVAAAVVALSYFTTRGFVAMTNYTDMALSSRMALDKMSRDIRQMSLVTACTTNSISLQDSKGNSLSYNWDPGARTLTCVSAGKTNIYLTQCDALRFWPFQHTPKSNTFDCYDPAYSTNTRLVQVTWTCSRQILSAKVNSEAVESAKIVLRNH